MKFVLMFCLLILATSCSSYEKQPTPEEEYLSTRRAPCLNEDDEKSYNCFIKKKSYDTLTYFSDTGLESKELKFKKEEKAR